MNKSIVFIFTTLLFGQTCFAKSPVLDFLKGHIKSYDYEIETSENYEFQACQEFNSDDDFEYYLTCVEGELVKEQEFSLLLKDVKAIETKVIEDIFLKDLKADVLGELKRNKKNVLIQKKCIGALVNKNSFALSNVDTIECQKIQKAVLQSIQFDLPKLRVLMGQKDTPGHIYSSKKPERFQRQDLIHEVNDRKVPDLTKSEADSLEKHTGVLEEAFVQDILTLNQNPSLVLKKSNQVGKIDKLLPCFGDIQSERCKASYEKSELIDGIEVCIDKSFPHKLTVKKSGQCQKFNTMLSFKVNNRFDKQNQIYQKEYNKKLSDNPLLSIVPLTGEENVDDIFKGVYSVLDELETNANKAISQISKLKGDDRKDLLGFNVAVEKFLKDRGPSQYMCDIGTELKSDRDFSELKTDLFIGGAALIGGGICAFSYGLGCAAGVAVGLEIGAVGISQHRLNNAKMAFNAGLTDAQITLDRESERNLSMYLAPLALVGEPGKLIIKNASKVGTKFVGRKTAMKQDSSPVDKEFLPPGDSRRYNFEKRKTLDDIQKSIGGERSKNRLFNRYYPDNEFKLDNADKIYIAAIAKDLEKSIRSSMIKSGQRPNSKSFKNKVRADTKAVLDSIARKCNGK
jgi:hypothetical protein